MPRVALCLCLVLLTGVPAPAHAAAPDAESAPAPAPPAVEAEPAPPAPEPHATAHVTAPAPSATTTGGDAPGEIIVVTGTRSETSLAAAPITTEVIDRKRIEESGVQTVSEALALRPGLWLDRGVAGTTGITIQGLGPRYSLILVDGARQIGRSDGYLDLDRFGVADVEQIEIVRGPSSALYGADALGGVVNIITRRPATGIAIDALSQLDDRLGSDTRGRLSLGSRGLAGALSGEFRQGPAIKRDGDDAVATTLDGYENRHLNARATDQRGDHWRLDASADYLYQNLQGVDAMATGAVFDRRNLVESASGQAGAQYAGDRTAVHLSADAGMYCDQYLYDQRKSNALDAYQVTDENLAEGSTQVVHQLGDHRGLIGGEILREALDSDRLSKPGARVRGAVYAQDEWRLTGDDTLIVVPALRFDDDSQFASHVTPRIAARWQVATGLAMRGSVGMGYRAPDFKELLLHFENPSVGYVVDGNPDLKPETSRSAQGGAEWQATPWLWLSLSGYYNGLHDLITAITEPDNGSGTLQFSYGNVGHARTAGLESYAMLSHGRAGLELGYALTRARDLDAERALEGVPMQRFTATARWRDPAYGVDAFAAFVVTSHRPFYLSDDPQMATLTPRRFELRARIGKRFANGLGGFVGIDNAFNAGDGNLDRLPPRTLYAGVELHR
jgi:outer membrane receptor for ferrienterochelin and colicins